MRFLNVIIVLISLALYGQALTPSSFLSTVDKNRLKSVFEGTLKKAASSDIPSLHYAILGYNLLGETKIPKEACDKLTPKIEDDNVVNVYQAASAGKAAGCKVAASEKTKKTVKAAVESSTVSSIYNGVLASISLGLPVDSTAVSKSLKAALKKDDSLTSLGQAFHVAANLKADAAGEIANRLEDALVQADEVDGKLLQFEGGLTVTNLIVGGALKLGEKVGKTSPLSKLQAIKFANYFLSRKSVQGVKGAYQLLEGINVLANNAFAVPVAVTLASPSTVSDASPKIRVKVTDLLGRPLNGNLNVVIDSATNKNDNSKVYLKKTKMAAVAGGENSLFEVDMKSVKPVKGFYTLTVSASPAKADDKLVGHQGATLEVKVLSAFVIEGVEIGVVEADQSTVPKLNSLKHPAKLPSDLKADHHHKVLLKFNLKDKDTNEPFKVHQAFVKLTNAKGEEIIFVAELTDAKKGAYKFELDLGSSGSSKKGTVNLSAYGSAKYGLDLIIGDAVVSNPTVWNLGNLDLNFGAAETSKKAPAENKPKPEIRHLFREPEVRPPTVVSNTFTILCLAPLLVMFALWAKLGVNISDFPCSLSSIGFHLGLGCIFGLYYYFWVQLNMFTTMKYLMMIGIVTFLCGNSMLVKIAEKRKVN